VARLKSLIRVNLLGFTTILGSAWAEEMRHTGVSIKHSNQKTLI